eukprot:TRINITY_DN8709_c0_g2_i4.p1 TRINITY_DN8709_c0_g2~~TRINITY_DN8709_c0_g2_i4.p1  ORF type:complete len:258 (-),score=29.88 TRINITY_DN8709_c0_g2_i4:60-833(-)
MGKQDYSRRAIGEGIAVMAIFILTYGTAEGNIINPLSAVSAYFIIFSFMQAPYGAQVNPAVTLSLFLMEKRKKDSVKYKKYIAFGLIQCIGALFGAMIINILQIDLLKLTPNNITSAFICEAMFTAVICFVCLVSCDRRLSASTPHIAGLTVGCAAVLASITIGPVSGGIVNPAIAFGLLFGRTFFQGGPFGDLKLIWLYILAPLLGAVLAYSIYFDILREERILMPPPEEEAERGQKARLDNQVGDNEERLSLIHI